MVNYSKLGIHTITDYANRIHKTRYRITFMNEQLNDLSEYLIEPYRVINYDIATTLQHRRIVYHTRLTNVDGSPLRARVNGKIKVWKTRPGHFELPCKYGLKFGFKITHENCHEWVVEV